MPDLLRSASQALTTFLRGNAPRILVVKQDVNEDLYCCPPDADTPTLISSTLLRTGPVSLFTDHAADFRMVQTVDDLECQIWQERATALEWDSLEFYASYRDRVPGRDYGQKRWSVSPESIDFNKYDIVISNDVCIPKRITQQYPHVLWCYYVREIKAPSYRQSLIAPAAGQDVVLNHHFRLQPAVAATHVLEFPYHLQRPGCFHKLFAQPQPSFSDRDGVFVDHHTMIQLSAEQRNRLQTFGPVVSTIHHGEREVIPTSESLARRTMDDDLKQRLLNSRYFLITPGQRLVFGTAMVEAIAAGCLVIGSPQSLGRHAFMFTEETSASDAAEAVEKMTSLNNNHETANAERIRQQQLVEYLCYTRPMNHLIEAWQRKLASAN